MQSYIESLYQL